MIRRIIKNNFTREKLMLIGLSIFIAFLLWSYVIGVVNPPRERTYRDVPVRYDNRSNLRLNGLDVVSPKEVTITVNVRGNKSALDNFSENSIRARIDLYGYSEGEHRIPVIVESNTPGVVIEDYEPKNVVFFLDEDFTDTKTISLTPVGELPENYILGSVEPEISEVAISGPKTVVENVEKVAAQYDIENRTDTAVISVPLIAYDSNNEVVEGIIIEPSNIDIQIPVYKTVTLPIVLNIRGTPPDNVSVRNIAVEPAEATISGSAALVDKLQELSTEPIDVNNIISGEVEYTSIVEPEGTKLINTSQQYKITYTLVRNITRVFQVPKSNIKAGNLQDGLSFSIIGDNEPVEVTLSGSEDIINSQQASNIELVLDLSNLVAGRHSVELGVAELDGLRVDSVNPNKIEVEIK